MHEEIVVTATLTRVGFFAGAIYVVHESIPRNLQHPIGKPTGEFKFVINQMADRVVLRGNMSAQSQHPNIPAYTDRYCIQSPAHVVYDDIIVSGYVSWCRVYSSSGKDPLYTNEYPTYLVSTW